MDTFEYLTEYYSNSDEDGRLASRHGQVEFLTTMRYIEKHLSPGVRILEIGAGTGRYSHALARKGFDVTAVELIQHNLDALNAKTERGETLTALQGNALDLSLLQNNEFYITLLLGPMYHLYTEEDQRRALSEALRVTKRGGMLFTAYCVSDASIIDFGFKKGHIWELIERKVLDTEQFKALSQPVDLFQLYRQNDIDRLMAGLPAERLHYVATDLWTNHMSETVDAMDDATFDFYLKYHFAMCEREDLVGLTHHSLDIVRKL